MLTVQIVLTISFSIVFGFIGSSRYLTAGFLAGVWLLGFGTYVSVTNQFSLWWMLVIPPVAAISASLIGVPWMKRQDEDFRATFIDPEPPPAPPPPTSVLLVVTPPNATVADIEAKLTVESIEAMAAFMQRDPKELLETITQTGRLDVAVVTPPLEGDDDEPEEKPILH